MNGPRPADEMLAYYGLGLEQGRLEVDYFPLERARTQELLLRHLAPPPGVVLDVGGAAGAYSFWLAEAGYEVHLVDPVSLHIEQAEAASRARPAGRRASARVADARALPCSDARADAVLLMGPLYHLQQREERLTALREALRVLRPGGLVFAAAISRFASLLDGLRGSLFTDDAFAHIVEQDLRDGLHRNDTGNARYFTTAFFHQPAELVSELDAGGFTGVGLYAVEGPGAATTDFARRWADPASRERLLTFLRAVEGEPALLGASPHLLAVGRRPS
jgi:ubiquinone/menaquinone biosynthesis C-methylase UbiE